MKTTFFILGFILFTLVSYAQKNQFKPFSINFSLFQSNIQHTFLNSAFSDSFTAMLPMFYKPQKLLMFCQLEANLHKRLHIWMVFRIGNDENYKKLNKK